MDYLIHTNIIIGEPTYKYGRKAYCENTAIGNTFNFCVDQPKNLLPRSFTNIVIDNTLHLLVNVL